MDIIDAYFCFHEMEHSRRAGRPPIRRFPTGDGFIASAWDFHQIRAPSQIPKPARTKPTSKWSGGPSTAVMPYSKAGLTGWGSGRPSPMRTGLEPIRTHA